MFVKDITKPENYSSFESKVNYWLKMCRQNSTISIFDIHNPNTLAEKMSWCTTYCDYNWKLFCKTTAKDEVIKILGTDKYIIPTYQICNSIKEVDWNSLIGKSFVIKPNLEASSHGIIIVKNLKKKDIEDFKNKCESNSFLKTGKIIVEKYIGNRCSKSLFQTDYKFWCFFGKPFCCEIVRRNNSTSNVMTCFYDTLFKKLPYARINYEWRKKSPKIPENFEEMVDLAKKLAQDMPVVRVDLYNINGRIYFGEFQKMYGYHCQFKNVNDDKSLSYLIDMDKIPSKYLNVHNRRYRVKIDPKTQEAKEILNCTDDELEFIFAVNKFPIYYNTNNKEIGIFNINNKWYQREYIEDFKIRPNTSKKIYNKKNKCFEPLRESDARKQLNMRSGQKISHEYDEDGDVVYYDPLEENVCTKYVDGHWETSEYDTVKVKKVKKTV